MPWIDDMNADWIADVALTCQQSDDVVLTNLLIELLIVLKALFGL